MFDHYTPKDWMYLVTWIIGVLSVAGLAIDRWVHKQESEASGLKREFLHFKAAIEKEIAGFKSMFEEGNKRFSQKTGETLTRMHGNEQAIERLTHRVVRLETIEEGQSSRKTPRGRQ